MSSESRAAPSFEGGRTRIADRYEILGLLGVGGMGSVYRARDAHLDEVVALKMLGRELARVPEMLARFRQEVKLARKVTHRNVARTFDLGEDGQDHFLTMELVDGESLGAIAAREGRLSVARVIELALPICEGLAAAHAVGVVHRDLKPDNVLVARDGRVVLTDFGIARALEGGVARTMGTSLGTPAYMAPEQVEASPDVDARADQFALGVMLFELLTGRLPWEGGSPWAVAAARLTQPAPDLRTLRSDVPDAIARVIERCLSRKPADRFPNVKDVSAQLLSATLPAPLGTQPPHASKGLETMAAPVAREDTGSAKTVAVLPLRNTGAAEDMFLAEGLTDDLIDSLSMTPGLRVRPRSAVMSAREARDPRDVGRDLGVQVVVEGSVRAAGDTVRLSVRVLSVADGFQLWAKRFDVPRGDVLRVADEAATAIAEALTVERPEAPRPVLTGATPVELYLRGRHEFFKFRPDANAKAVDMFEQARAARPDDPQVLSALAMALARQFGYDAPLPDLYTRARRAVERALELAPESADALIALAQVELNAGDPTRCGRAVADALARNPSSPDAHEMAARLLAETGPEEACERFVDRALDLEPRFLHLHFLRARLFALAERWDEVTACFARPPEPHAQTLYWLSRARLTLWHGDRAEAAAQLDRLGDFPYAEIIRLIYGIVASRQVPDEVFQEMDRRTSAATSSDRIRTFYAQLAAELAAFAGKTEIALDHIAKAGALSLIDVAWLDHCVLLAPLRGDARFVRAREASEARAGSIRAPLLATAWARRSV